MELRLGYKSGQHPRNANVLPKMKTHFAHIFATFERESEGEQRVSMSEVVGEKGSERKRESERAIGSETEQV